MWHMEYEDALLEYFHDVRVGHEKIGGLPWTEIDFVNDIKKLSWKFCQDCEKVTGLSEYCRASVPVEP